MKSAVLTLRYKWMTYGETSTARSAIGSGLQYHGISKALLDLSASLDVVKYIINHADIQALHDKLLFVTDSDREQLIAKLQETEDWLYEDGEDETKGVYVAKLYELKKLNLEFTVYGGFEITRVLHLEGNVEQQKE
ncbi:heat shock 70 kDa protein 15-like protein [Tanacetum coccineum]